MKTTTRNRLLSLTVTLCLVFGSLPAAAFAAEEEVGPSRQPEQEEVGTLPDVERAEPDIVAPSPVADEALPAADAVPSPIASPSSALSSPDADKAAGGALDLLKTAIDRLGAFGGYACVPLSFLGRRVRWFRAAGAHRHGREFDRGGIRALFRDERFGPH